jgi:hypothetical protein
MNPILFFLGGDPAPSENQSSDDGALTVAAATPRRILQPNEPLPKTESDWFVDYVYARVFTAKHHLSATQWSGMIYTLDQRFGGFAQAVLDAGAGGGGIYVKREMQQGKQLLEGVKRSVVPICDKTIETQREVAHARFILNLFKRGDPGVESVWPDPNGGGKSLAGDELLKDALYCGVREALNMGVLRFLPPADEYLQTHAEEVRSWEKERVWALKNISAGAKQLINIVMETVEKDGQQVEVRTSRGARKFSSVGKDDIALSMMYTYAAFRIWLQGEDFEQPNPEDEAGFGGFPN